MYVQLDLFDLVTLSLLLIASLFASYLKGKSMSAGSNLKDAVSMLNNSHSALQAALSNHIASTSALTADTEVQAAADAINSIAVSLTQAANSLMPK